MKLRAGDWVEVCSKDEILRSLDGNGCLEGMPFMPEMFQYCGKRFRVYKRAHKTCDTISGDYLGRRVSAAVHLEDLRCSGEAHGGCQAACLLFWKEAWLKQADGVPPNSTELQGGVPSGEAAGCTEDAVWKATRVEGTTGGETRWVCQATELLRFTAPLPWWHVGQYAEDLASGNASLGRMLRAFAYVALKRPNSRFPAFRKLYDWVQSRLGGVPYPRRQGGLPAGAAAPAANLELEPGELVRVKAYEAILATLGPTNKHLGLFFDAEMVPYCGGIYRVRARITKFLDEKTGRMCRLKTPAVILENVLCQSCFSSNRMLCPRSIYSWWREVWLERVGADNGQRQPDA
jgi:hypothetical protein